MNKPMEWFSLELDNYADWTNDFTWLFLGIIGSMADKELVLQKSYLGAERRNSCYFKSGYSWFQNWGKSSQFRSWMLFMILFFWGQIATTMHTVCGLFLKVNLTTLASLSHWISFVTHGSTGHVIILYLMLIGPVKLIWFLKHRLTYLKFASEFFRSCKATTPSILRHLIQMSKTKEQKYYC